MQILLSPGRTKYLLFAHIANGGQNCCAGSRLLIEEPVHDALIEKLEKRVAKLKVGHPMTDGVDVGPLGK